MPRFRRPKIAAQAPLEAGLIQSANIGQRLIQALGIRGRTQAPTLAPDVQPVILVEDLTDQNWYSQLVDRAAGGSNLIAPTAGQYATLQLYNPATSGVVAIVDWVAAMTPSSASLLYFYLSQTEQANASPTSVFTDTAKLQTATPSCRMRSGDTVAAQFGFQLGIMYSSTTNVPREMEPKVILAPGWGFGVALQAASVNLLASFRWRERHQ
jgi:hypothetical protein